MSQYKSILKATSLFGGTQLFQILITLVRTKFVALLIGATGMGLNAMYMSSLSMVITIFGMGINTSVVRDLSKANDDGDEERFSKIMMVFNRMLLILSFLGTLFVVLFSSYFSIWSFGNRDYTKEYIALSLVVMFTLLAQGNTAKLIGKRKVKDTAFSSLFGAIVTLLTSVPFFYFWGLDGIVPGLIVSTIANYLITLFYSRKVKLADVRVSLIDMKSYGGEIFLLGFTLVLAVLIGNVTVYGINIVIRHFGGIDDIGYYNAGMSMTGQAVSLVFSAMSADYFPRLVASLKDKRLMNETINQQCEILVHLCAPILAIFSILSPFIIRLLLSNDFLVINSFIRIICFGMLIKAVCYALGNVSFAKGDKFVYMILEGGYGNMMNFISSVVFYYFWGLKGLAYAFVFSGVLYFFIILIVDKKRYGFEPTHVAKKVVAINLPLMFAMMIADVFLVGIYYYLIAIFISIFIIPYNLFYLNKKTELVRVIINKFK